MMSYGSEIFFGVSENVLEWEKPQCIFIFEKKVFLNDPTGQARVVLLALRDNFNLDAFHSISQA